MKLKLLLPLILIANICFGTNVFSKFEEKENMPFNTKHGHTTNGVSPEYSCFRSMKGRCQNPRNKKYPIYGGRGIKVCERWLKDEGVGFLNFFADMGKRPSIKYTLGRINNDGNYEPSNCRWETIDQQTRNRRSNIWIEYNGERKVQKDWALSVKAKLPHFRRMLLTKTFSETYEYYKNKLKSTA